jgi:hypothetical protein
MGAGREKLQLSRQFRLKCYIFRISQHFARELSNANTDFHILTLSIGNYYAWIILWILFTSRKLCNVYNKSQWCINQQTISLSQCMKCKITGALHYSSNNNVKIVSSIEWNFNESQIGSAMN